MEGIISQIQQIAVDAGSKLLLALLVFIVGRILIRKLVSAFSKITAKQNIDPTVASFLSSCIKIALYAILVISIISILGVPMTSVIAVLTSAGIAIGMSLQGSLSNLAGGIMLLIFRPFNVGDYISASGAGGTVQSISLFYTILDTPDGVRVTIPNGSLMNANVENYSSQPIRRVDMVFTTDRLEDFKKVQDIITEVMEKNELILKNPAPFVSLSGATNEAMEFTVRPYCKSADYWGVYFSMNQEICEALGKAGIKAPKLRIVQEEK
jgi:small conductance mechanosensitive channel